MDICISINNIVSGRHLSFTASSAFLQIFDFDQFSVMLFLNRDR